MSPTDTTEMGGALPALDTALTFANPLGAAVQAAATEGVTKAATGKSSSGGILGWLFGGLTGVQDFLPNAGLVLIGVVLGLGALFVSQKQTIVNVASKAAEL